MAWLLLAPPLLCLALSSTCALRSAPVSRQQRLPCHCARRPYRHTVSLWLLPDQGGNQTAGPAAGRALDMSSSSSSKNSQDDELGDTNNILIDILTKNFVFRIFSSTYSFFWALPRKNLVYDIPWTLFRNNSIEFIAWYQFPHNLPPYRYLQDCAYPDDFFCYGLPGATLPLGQWDPAGLHLVHEKVVRKYRESEIKHGRLAMLGTTGMAAQEFSHPLHPDVGGLAITHMQQLQHKTEVGLHSLCDLLTADAADAVAANVGAVSVDVDVAGMLAYPSVLLLLVLCETAAFARNCYVPGSDEYRHQFSHNIGIANLRTDYECGNYGFDPLKLLPTSKRKKREMQEKELNNGRLAMVAFVGMLAQEYLLGLPLRSSLAQLAAEGPAAAPRAEVMGAGSALAELWSALARFATSHISGLQAL